MDAGDTERGFNRLSGRDLVGLMQESGAVTHATLQPLDVDMEVACHRPAASNAAFTTGCGQSQMDCGNLIRLHAADLRLQSRLSRLDVASLKRDCACHRHHENPHLRTNNSMKLWHQWSNFISCAISALMLACMRVCRHFIKGRNAKGEALRGKRQEIGPSSLQRLKWGVDGGLSKLSKTAGSFFTAIISSCPRHGRCAGILASYLSR
eukprot:1156056-Pelagomonas_calceolata.AAC.4